MKWAIILLAIMMIGCTQVQTEVKEVDLEVSTSAYTEQKKVDVKEFDIRALEQGLDPQVIKVNKGDKVILNVVNTYEEDNDGIDDNDAKRINVEHYAEDFYHSGTAATLSFVADKKGTFAIGDESDKMPKGYLIVQ